MRNTFLLILLSMLLNACAVSPAPQKSTSVSPAEPIAPTPLLHEEEPPLVVDSSADFDFHGLHRRIDSLLVAGDTLQTVALLEKQVQSANNLNELGKRSFLLARLLHEMGRDSLALEVIGAFVSYKPALLEWMEKADSLERNIRGEQREQIQDFQPIIKQISNFMATSGDYSLVRELTDSIRSERIPDSLRRWCGTQDSIALRKTVLKLIPRLDAVKKLVLEEGNFTKAREGLENLRRLNPELVAALGVDSVGKWLERLEKKEREDQSPAFWKGKDPQKVWEEAKNNVRLKKWDKGIFLYRQLQASSLRKQTLPELRALGESYCQFQRQSAAEEFSRSRGETPEKAKTRIEKALQNLNSCLSEFPDYSSVIKVQQNMEILKKELERRTP